MPVFAVNPSDTKEAKTQKAVYQTYNVSTPCHSCTTSKEDCSHPVDVDRVQYRSQEAVEAAVKRYQEVHTE